MLRYLTQNPIDFITPELAVKAELCEGCQTTGGCAHVATMVIGPAGEHAEHFTAVSDALNYLLTFAAQLAAHGRPCAWDFAHYLTTWVMQATDGVSQAQPTTPRRAH